MSDDVFDLDTDLDDVADLVQFTNPHDGTHKFAILYAGDDKVGNSKRGIKIIYQMLEYVEAANADAIKAPIGSLFSESFTGNDMGKKLLKLRLKQFFGDDISGSMRQYIEALNTQFKSEYNVQLTTKTTQSKVKDKETGDTNVYTNVRILDAEACAPVTLPDGFELAEYTPSVEEA